MKHSRYMTVVLLFAISPFADAVTHQNRLAQPELLAAASSSGGTNQSVADDQDNSPSNLNEAVPSEERKRLRRDLDDYSRGAYGTQLDNRRLGQPTADEGRRLRRDLDDYSRGAYGTQLDIQRQAMREKMQERIKNADRDSDGSISREEARDLPRLSKRFDQIDTNGDGIISKEEMQAAREVPDRQSPEKVEFKASKDTSSAASIQKTKSVH